MQTALIGKMKLGSINHQIRNPHFNYWRADIVDCPRINNLNTLQIIKQC